MYKHSNSSVGANKKHIQITPKYRYKMMRKDKLRVFCKVAIEEACKRHRISLEIIKVMDEHVHMIVDVPRTMSDSKALQIIKGLSSYILFQLCPNLRLRYPNSRLTIIYYVISDDVKVCIKHVDTFLRAIMDGIQRN